MISIVVPVFNEQEALPLFYERLISAAKNWFVEYELIFVDDGSEDESLQLMKIFVEENSKVKILKLSRNFGHQPALSAGIKMAKGAAVVLLDADLQDPPELIGQFLAKWKEGYFVVYGIRRNRREGFIKKLGYKMFYRLVRMVSETKIPLDAGDFCLMDKRIVESLNNDIPEVSRFLRGLRAYVGFKQIGIEYNRGERIAGQVKYSFRNLIKLALDGLFDFSTVPLRLATYLGFLISIPSFLLGLFFIVHRIFNFKILGYSPQDTPGLASLAVGIYFLGGVILIILGIIGEYLGRVYYEIKRRPYYVIEELITKE